MASKSKGQYANANPAKQFFVSMLTRDIPLEDCIFDLLDNACDGAKRESATRSGKVKSLNHYQIQILMSRESFRVEDNCGGISLDGAMNYAFRFGREQLEGETDVPGGIGLYGIGMKRAIFKIGRQAQVISHAENDSFEVQIDVAKWLEKKEDWRFPISALKKSSEKPGVILNIDHLYPSVASAFESHAFITRVRKNIARDYAFLLSKGLKIRVNGQDIQPIDYTLKTGENFQPAHLSYVDEESGVSVVISAGIMGDLADDSDEELKSKDVDRWGWYVVCNDRVVLAADRTERTVWGDDKFQVWHPQYRGFGGFVIFHAEDPSLLPWTTSKRDLDESSPLYRRTLKKMKDVTEPFIEYSQIRKSSLDKAHLAESKTAPLSIKKLKLSPSSSFPQFVKSPAGSRIIRICYDKPKDQIDKVKDELGSKFMTAKDVGKRTFDYFWKKEIE